MRANLRLPSRSGDSHPWWLALPLAVLWSVLSIFFWICAAVWIVARFTTQQAQRGWRAVRGRRPG